LAVDEVVKFVKGTVYWHLRNRQYTVHYTTGTYKPKA